MVNNRVAPLLVKLAFTEQLIDLNFQLVTQENRPSYFDGWFRPISGTRCYALLMAPRLWDRGLPRTRGWAVDLSACKGSCVGGRRRRLFCGLFFSAVPELHTVEGPNPSDGELAVASEE